MDRSICVLIYSEFSHASKRLMDYIQSRPCDIAAITGLSMLVADTQEIRDSLTTLAITSVPCIFIKYFDGTSALYADNDAYAFVDAITSSVSIAPSINVDLEEAEKEEEIKPQVPLKRVDVMAAALAMHKGREVKEKALQTPPFPPSKKTKLV